MAITPGHQVCRSCDNPAYCNPHHLWTGPARANVRDRQAKGRSARGSAHGRAELCEDQVRAIRQSNARPSVLARAYGVSHTTIRRIRLGHRWKHLAGP